VRRSILFIQQHGRILFSCLVLCMMWSLTAAPSAGALVNVGELRKTIREIDLLNKRQVQDEAQPQKSDGSLTSGAREQSRSVSSTPKSTPAEGASEAVSSPAVVIDPLPVIDTSPLAYPSLKAAAFGSVTTASVLSTSPAAANSQFPAATVEASPGGWHIAGVAWYWWLLSILAVGVGVRWHLSGRRWAELVSSKV
jgi:hypothetical protein